MKGEESKVKIKRIKKEDDLYPNKLREINSSPKELYAIGNIELLNIASIAIVGSRDCDEYGKEQTKRFSSYLAQKGLCIVSGLARGVDSFAHNSAKDKNGKTIAVLASGFDYIYPKENRILFDEILNEGGCIISEWSPDTKIEMNRFPRRNRIISGLSIATLVVEAKYRSGTVITAHYAMKQKREVFCIPGNIDSVHSYGTNKLVSEGAMLVTSPRDILESIEYIADDTNVDTEYQDVYSLIGDIPISADEIARKLKVEVSEVNQKLLMLEIDDFIKQSINGKYVKAK